MPDPVYFVVEPKKGGVGEFPAVYHDRLPDRLTTKGQIVPIYVVRLDLLEGLDYVAMSLDELYRRYALARDAGRLVHNVAKR